MPEVQVVEIDDEPEPVQKFDFCCQTVEHKVKTFEISVQTDMVPELVKQNMIENPPRYRSDS